jgi:uncharacterized protein YkwD
MRSIRAITLVVALAVFVSAGPVTSAGAVTTKKLRNDMFSLVNASRRSHGIRPMRISWSLSRHALAHSRRMVRRNRVYHTTDLYSVVRRYRPRTWGENVGMAGTLRRMQRLFMRSPSHRANTLNRRFHRIGVGVVRARGHVWVTLDFFGG